MLPTLITLDFPQNGGFRPQIMLLFNKVSNIISTVRRISVPSENNANLSNITLFWCTEFNSWITKLPLVGQEFLAIQSKN